MLLISNEKNMEKFELNLDYKEVVDYGAMFVNPKYVGRNLQYQMLNVLDTYAKNNNYKYAVVTVHPDNSFSINNILKDNFKMHLNKDFKRGNRNIYLKVL
jgi:L-amino acid N-acyltransferase YncA